HRPGVVHRLIGHAGAHRAVADHRDDVALFALEVARHGHAEPRGNRGRTVRRAKRVVFAFRSLGEPRQPAALADRADAIAAAGDDLVEQRRPIGDMDTWFLIQCWAPHVRRFTTNRATCRRSSALCSNKSRWATAWSINSSACARARSAPRIETKVALPAAPSAPTG